MMRSRPRTPGGGLSGAVLLGMLALILATGFYGIDFGRHWDEGQFVESLIRSLRTGFWLPLSYNYPSLCYDLFVLGILPDLIAPSANLAETAASLPFLLRMRAVFIVLSSGAVLWLYLWVRAWRKNRAEALLAAAVYGLSWETAYHARWAVSDTILAQFAALTLLCLFLAREAPSAAQKKWLRAAAVAAGLAFGTKYQGLLLGVPVFLAVVFWALEGPGLQKKTRLCSELLGLFLGVYFLTTPGTLMDRAVFWRDIVMQQRIYSTLGCGGHTVAPGLEHLWLNLQYLSAVLFSRYGPIAGFFFALAVLGTVSLIKEERKTAAVLLSFPLLFLSVLCLQRVMAVRNLLVLAPFLAVLASRGALVLFNDFLRNPAVKRLFSFCLGFFLVLNAVWLVRSAASIRAQETDKDIFVKELARYLDGYPPETFFATERVIGELRRTAATDRFDTLKNFSPRTRAVVLYSSEVSPWQRWTANRLDYTWRWFGPHEVNFNYYPDWAGRERLVVLPVRWALKLKDDGAKYLK